MTEPSLLTAPVLLTAIAFLGTMLAMYALVLRFGPRRGNWNSPAAAFRPPGRAIQALLLGVAAAHVVVGIILAIGLDSSRIAVLVTCIAMGAFYAIASQAVRLAAHAPRPPVERAR